MASALPEAWFVGGRQTGKHTCIQALLKMDVDRSLQATWDIKTKYYKAQIAVKRISSKEPAPKNAACEALVLLIDASRESTFQEVITWLRTYPLDAEIRLLVANKIDLISAGTAGSVQRPAWLSAAMQWSVDECYEYIEVCSSQPSIDQQLTLDGEKQGVARVADALKAHMWPGMEREPHPLRTTYEVPESPTSLASDSADGHDADGHVAGGHDADNHDADVEASDGRAQASYTAVVGRTNTVANNNSSTIADGSASTVVQAMVESAAADLLSPLLPAVAAGFSSPSATSSADKLPALIQPGSISQAEVDHDKVSDSQSNSTRESSQHDNGALTKVNKGPGGLEARIRNDGHCSSHGQVRKPESANWMSDNQAGSYGMELLSQLVAGQGREECGVNDRVNVLLSDKDQVEEDEEGGLEEFERLLVEMQGARDTLARLSNEDRRSEASRLALKMAQMLGIDDELSDDE